MALFVFVLVIVIIIYLVIKGETTTRQNGVKNDQQVRHRKLTDDEVVTVILPTINNDGK